jgi:hypothetical protein
MKNYRRCDAVASAQTAKKSRYGLRIRGDSKMMRAEKTGWELQLVGVRKGAGGSDIGWCEEGSWWQRYWLVRGRELVAAILVGRL